MQKFSAQYMAPSAITTRLLIMMKEWLRGLCAALGVSQHLQTICLKHNDSLLPRRFRFPSQLTPEPQHGNASEDTGQS